MFSESDVSAIDELKAQARVLHGQIKAGQPSALARVRDQKVLAVMDELQRRHCLVAVARENGFKGWQHATAVLRGEDSSSFGKLLYPRGGAAHSNIWCASYDEARELRAQTRGYLLAYQHQYFIADDYFVRDLGLDPDDPDWRAIARDWVQPGDYRARDRLYCARIRARRAASAKLQP